jgi:hypothetical protein
VDSSKVHKRGIESHRAEYADALPALDFYGSGCGSASCWGSLDEANRGPQSFGESLAVEIAFLQRGWRVTAHQPSEDGAAGMPARHRHMAMGTLTASIRPARVPDSLETIADYECDLSPLVFIIRVRQVEIQL